MASSSSNNIPLRTPTTSPTASTPLESISIVVPPLSSPPGPPPPGVNVPVPPVVTTSTTDTSTVSHSQSQSQQQEKPTPPSQPGHTPLFLSTLPEIRNMEQSLLSLLSSFNAGELSAFGQSKLDTMNLIREKQERLARMHFELSGKGDGSNWMSDTDENKLLAGLRELSVEIEKLNENNT